eukprot:202359-Amorphochlora_amoeboformis.AAC.1
MRSPRAFHGSNRIIIGNTGILPGKYIQEMMVRAQKTGKPNGETPEEDYPLAPRREKDFYPFERRACTMQESARAPSPWQRYTQGFDTKIWIRCCLISCNFLQMESLVLPKLTHLYLQVYRLLPS